MQLTPTSRLISMTFEEIRAIWLEHLFEGKKTDVKPTSSIVYLGGIELSFHNETPLFWGLLVNDNGRERLVGVNSGFRTGPEQFRSRGLFVFPEERGKGFAIQLLQAAIDEGKRQGCAFVWSMPRTSAQKTYEKSGFVATSAPFSEYEFGPHYFARHDLTPAKTVHTDTKVVPDSVCIVPFIHFSTKPDGLVRVCCMSRETYVRRSDGQTFRASIDGVNQAFQSEWMNVFRKRMLSGEKPLECQACWREEQKGKPSKRLSENKKYLQQHSERIETARQNDGAVQAPPIYFDLRLGNLCNLKCRTCNPLFSSKWATEFDRYSQEPELAYYRGTRQEAEAIGDWYRSPALWDELILLLPSIEEIYLSGGEPTLIAELTKLLRICVESEHAGHIRIRFNTNLTLVPSEWPVLFQSFKEVIVSASMDAIGIRNDWLRPPSKWSEVWRNLKTWSNAGEPVRTEVNCTVSAFNITVLDELFSHIKSEHPDVYINLDILHDPEFMTLWTLPDSLKSSAQDRLTALLQSPIPNRSERSRIEGVLQLLSLRDRDIEKRQVELRAHTHRLDQIRDENCSRVFPELSDFLNGDK